MALKRTADTTEVGGAAVAISEPVVGQTATATLTGGPADVDVIFSIATPDGGAAEQTVHTDENGEASVDVVPSTTGTLSVAVSQTTTTAVGAASAEVSGSAPAEALSLTGIDPTSSVVGPPESVLLVITGTGFDINTRAAFGVFSAAEAEAGAGVEGEPKWEMATRFVSDTTVTLEISQGLFPGADPAIPVLVGQPDGTTAGPVNFAFTEEE